MLYPNLQININKKRGAGALEDAQVINTPVILDLAVQMSDEKHNFAFSNQPSLNQLKMERQTDDKNNNLNLSLQTPVLDFINQPFFNQTSCATSISPGDELNNFVAPNDILNTYTTASSTSTSTTIANLPMNTNNAYNSLTTNQQSNHLNLIDSNESHHMNQSNKLISSIKQNTSIHQQQQSDYQFTITSTGYNPNMNPNAATGQLNQYTSNLLNHQQTDLNDNLIISNTLNHPHLNQQHDHQGLIYTELKSSNQPQSNQTLIPHSVYDMSSSHKKAAPYASPSSPTTSVSSQTSSSNLDNQDMFGQQNNYGESSTSHLNRSNRRFQASGQSTSSEKKSRMTKKQKYDAMINEEKDLMNNNEQLRKDIKNLEDMIYRYKQTIMNVVRNSSNNNN